MCVHANARLDKYQHVILPIAMHSLTIHPARGMNFNTGSLFFRSSSLSFLSFCLSCGTQKTNRPWAVCVCVCALPPPGRGNKLIQSRLKMRHGSAHKPHQVSFFWTAMSCWSSQRLLLNNKCLCAAVIPRNSFLSPPLLHFLLKEAPETFFPGRVSELYSGRMSTDVKTPRQQGCRQVTPPQSTASVAFKKENLLFITE